MRCPASAWQRLEVFNWGTFDDRVWTLQAGRQERLADRRYRLRQVDPGRRGDHAAGAGHRVAYNKAAGAGQKERSLRSYVLGYYKSERNELERPVRPSRSRCAITNSLLGDPRRVSQCLATTRP